MSVGYYAGEKIFLCCTRGVVTVIGKDHDSLSSQWTFNEALFMLQPQRERAEKCQAGLSRRAVWGWKHFEVRVRLRGLITRPGCHSRQPAKQSEKKSKAEPGFTFPTPPEVLIISWKHLRLSRDYKGVILFFLEKRKPPGHLVKRDILLVEVIWDASFCVCLSWVHCFFLSARTFLSEFMFVPRRFQILRWLI